MSDLVLKRKWLEPVSFVWLPSSVGGVSVYGIGGNRNTFPDDVIWDLGSGTMPVTCLQNVAIARKQNLAGVVNENNTGRTWAASDNRCQHPQLV